LIQLPLLVMVCPRHCVWNQALSGWRIHELRHRL
jgi:hypothetical protein